jgi:hypothetical protein
MKARSPRSRATRGIAEASRAGKGVAVVVVFMRVLYVSHRSDRDRRAQSRVLISCHRPRAKATGRTNVDPSPLLRGRETASWRIPRGPRSARSTSTSSGARRRAPLVDEAGVPRRPEGMWFSVVILVLVLALAAFTPTWTLHDRGITPRV